MNLRSQIICVALLSGCIENVGRGPNLGDCADVPDGVYTYGEIGIGTCLASPADITFFEDNDGKTWLSVANANHYYNFDSGSVLLIDWDTVDKTKGALNYMHTLTAVANDSSNYIGAVAPVPSRDLLLATERYSEDSLTTAYDDDLLVFDISDPLALQAWPEGGTLTLEDDPQTIVVDEQENVAYVLNITDHSISIIDLSDTPLSVMPIGGEATLSLNDFVDADGSGSRAAIVASNVLDEGRMRDDLWTLTWLRGTTRLWAPQDEGFYRYHTGGTGWTGTGSGADLAPDAIGATELQDPFFFPLDNLPGMFFSADGRIYAGAVADGTALNWVLNSTPALTGSEEEDAFDHLLGSPSVIDDGQLYAIYYDARSATGDAVIAAAFENAAGNLTRSEAAVISTPDGQQSLEDPFVVFDSRTNTYRMWMSQWNGAEWSVGHSQSDDGVQWSAVTSVTGLSVSAAAPVVVPGLGRYELWFTTPGETAWQYGYAWSWDGIHWQEDSIVSTASLTFDIGRPPRLGVQSLESSGFRMEGNDSGLVSGLVVPGGTFSDAEHGFSIEVAAGYHADGPDLADHFANSVSPSSLVSLDGTDVLYIHGIGSDGQSHIGAVNAETFDVLSDDLIDSDLLGALSNPSHPVVFAVDEQWLMVFSATDSDNVVRMYLADSDDGLDWTPSTTPLIQDDRVWHEGLQYARSIEVLEDGRIRAWYAGSNGNRFRIGSAILDVPSKTLTAEDGPSEEWAFGTGALGTFDDTNVYDPVVFTYNEQTHLIYSAFDGEQWSLGHAIRTENGVFERATNSLGDTLPTLKRTLQTFASNGVDSPVVHVGDTGIDVWYAGIVGDAATENGIRRIGFASGQPNQLFPHQNAPTLGDTMTFETRRDGAESNVINLAQSVDAFSTAAGGASGLRLDSERGFLYVTAKLNNYIYVVDIRDDSDDTFDDRNYLDLEALISVESTIGSRGFRDAIAPEGTNRLYAAGQRPDALVVFNLDPVEDNAVKEVYTELALGSLPLQPSTGQNSDAGASTGVPEPFGGGQMVFTDDKQLLVTQFLDNSVSVFDLSGAGLGTEVKYLPAIGESPYALATSPDGRYAVVANYVGKALENGSRSSTLTVVDIDKQSPTYLEPLTWISNR